LGAAALAGLGSGFLAGPEAITAAWRPAARFTPAMREAERSRLYAGWRDAVARVRSRPHSLP
jgi:glycerol kinase